jgi:hypothetical protein
MRAERPKLKSRRRDDIKISQGKRGTSAALGEQDKGRLGGGVVYPGRQSLRSFALGYYLAAPPGRRTGGQAAFTANQRAGADAGQLACSRSWSVRPGSAHPDC